MNGKFIISLDFEIFWGVSETKNLENYKENLANTEIVVKRLLDIFEEYNIRSTWATVGFLFFDKVRDLIDFTNDIKKPTYQKAKLNNYSYFDLINNDTLNFFFAKKLIEIINDYPNQEIGTHTFSHYYTLENGQKISQFNDDIIYAIDIAKKNNIVLNSIVFPRNQYTDKHVSICKSAGISVFRGNQNHWIYKPDVKQGFFKRGFRLLDAYFNISGNNTFFVQEINGMKNIKSSRFLRPYNSKLKFAESLRLKRILNEMNYAAKNNKCYHLWWHPHNFGRNTDENFNFLIKILEHFKKLNLKYNFSSKSMCDFK